MANTASTTTLEQTVPVLNRPETSGWRSALWPLAMLTVMLATIIQSCVEQPEIPPRFDAVATTLAANQKALQTLQSLSGTEVGAEKIVAALNLVVINFAPGSDQLPDDAQNLLKTAAPLLAALPEQAQVTLVGHTDNQGSVIRNLGLSLQRAQAVRDALVSAGVDSTRLNIAGAGDSRPVASNATEAGRFANRRIEFVLRLTSNE